MSLNEYIYIYYPLACHKNGNTRVDWYIWMIIKGHIAHRKSHNVTFAELSCDYKIKYLILLVYNCNAKLEGISVSNSREKNRHINTWVNSKTVSFLNRPDVTTLSFTDCSTDVPTALNKPKHDLVSYANNYLCITLEIFQTELQCP